MDIDYDKYGREDLESALRAIDKEKHPENYRRALAAWERLQAQGPQEGARPEEPAAPVPVYRNFWRRIGATLLDGLIMMPLGLAPFYIFKADFNAGIAYYLLLMPLGAVYHIWFHTRYGATPGKMAVGLKLMTADLQRVRLEHAARRSAPEIALAIVSAMVIMPILFANREAIPTMGFMAFAAMLGSGSAKSVGTLSNLWIYSEWITMLFNPRRRAIHDFIGGTVVVRWVPPARLQ